MRQSTRNGSTRKVRGYGVIAVAAAALLAQTSAMAQVSSTWLPAASGSSGGSAVPTGADWGVGQQWVDGTPVDGGGVATFPEAAGLRAEFLNNNFGDNVAVTSTYSVSQINIASAEPYSIGGPTGTLVLTGAGSLNVTDSAATTLVSFAQGHAIGAVVAGGPLTKTGSGNAVLTSSGNTYVGGTTITGGTLWAANDGALGATGSGNGVTLNGGTLGLVRNSFSSTGRTIQVGPAGGALLGNGTITFGGPIAGGSANAALTIAGIDSTLTAASTFAGTLVQTGTATAGKTITTMNLTGNGSLTGLAALDITGTLSVDNTVSGVLADRINNSATLISRGATLTFRNGATAAPEQIGTLQLAGGLTSVTFTGTAGSSGLSMGSIVRGSDGTLLATGISGTPIGTVTVATAPEGLVGTGTQILPWAAAGNSFLTYAGTTLRPLTTTETVRVANNANVPATSDATNLLLAAANSTFTGTGATVNSIVFAGATPKAADANFSLTVSSGGLLFTANATVLPYAISFPTTGGPSGGGVQGTLFITSNMLTTSSTFSGNAGLLKTGTGAWRIAYGSAGTNSAYTGGTTLNAGATFVPGNIGAEGTPSALGAGPIRIVGSAGDTQASAGFGTRVFFGFAAGTANATVARDISVAGDSFSQVSVIAANAAAGTVTYAGTVSLTSATTALMVSQGTHVFNGPIVGPGMLSDIIVLSGNPAGTIVLNASGSYQGGTHAYRSRYVLGNDGALGSGTLEIGGPAGTYPTIAATPGAGNDAVRTIPNKVLIDEPVIFGTYGNTAVPLVFTGAVDLNGSIVDDHASYVTVVAGMTATFAGVVSRGAVMKTGPGTLVLSNPSNAYVGDTVVEAGTLKMTGAIRNKQALLVRSGVAAISFDGPALAAIAVAPSASSHAVVGEFAAITAQSTGIHTGTVSVAATDRSTLQQTVLITGSVDLADFSIQFGPAYTGGVVDLANNDMLVHSTSPAQLGTYAATGHLISSVATPITGLGIISNADGKGGALYASFDGVAAVATDALVKYTYLGDTDLNGYVDGADLANLLAGMNGGLTGWANGDLNYSGAVDQADLDLLMASLSGQTVSFGSPGGGGSSVPEPGVAAPAALALAGLARRSRRRR